MGLWDTFTSGIGATIKTLTGGGSYLSEEEKQKDRDVITSAYEILSQMQSGEEELPEENEEEEFDMEDETKI